MTIRILHTTDTFLDRKNLSRKSRRKDYLSAFKQAIAHALRKDVDCVIHTGDLFWTKRPPKYVVDECRKALNHLSEAGISFWLVYGDRDSGQVTAQLEEFSNQGLLRRLPSRWHTLEDVSVYGVDTTTDLRSLERSEGRPRRPRIVCAHDEVDVNNLTRSLGMEIDALLLGGQKRPVDRTESGCRVLSPGSPERIIGKWTIEDEASAWHHPRRVNVYDVTADSISVEPLPIDAREYEGLEIETDLDTTLEDIERHLERYELANKAALLVLRGQKGSRNLSRKAIQDVLADRSRIARVYDRRDEVDVPNLESGEKPNQVRKDDLPVTVTRDDIAELGSSSENSPVASAIRTLQTRIEAAFRDTGWFDPFDWDGDPGSPYVGPPNPDGSEYVWVGFCHETYQPLGKPTLGIQLEFGVSAPSKRGFFDRGVICGLYAGPWADDSVVDDVADRLRNHREAFVSFVNSRSEYVLVTKDRTWHTLSPEDVTSQADRLAKGFVLTLDLSPDDLDSCDDLTELVWQSFLDVLPLYCKLAGVDCPDEVKLAREEAAGPEDTVDDSSPGSVEPTVESIAAHSSILDAEDVEQSITNLTDRGASRAEALEYIRQYAVDMERGDGLYTVHGLGPVAGYALDQAGITTVRELATSSFDKLRQIDGLRESQARTILENARDEEVTPSVGETAESPPKLPKPPTRRQPRRGATPRRQTNPRNATPGRSHSRERTRRPLPTRAETSSRTSCRSTTRRSGACERSSRRPCNTRRPTSTPTT